MEPAVALAQAYLYSNQYLTVTEYPVIESMGDGRYRAATDIDLIAVRFPEAGRFVPEMRDANGGRESARNGNVLDEVDPALGAPSDRVHVIIGEVKEGRAELNRGARDPRVLTAALRRVGRYGLGEHDATVDQLIRKGVHDTDRARVSIVAFGSYPGDRGPFTTITFGQVVRFMRRLAREHWDVLQTAQFKDPALAFLMLLEKSRFDRPEGAPSDRRRRGRRNGH